MSYTKPGGFTLVDVIVGISLLLIVFLALFGILRASLILSTLAKAKTTATETASTQMEYLRGFSYDALGTIGGIPSGSIPQVSTTTIDGINYTVRTLIIYRDDPADGFGAQDINRITTDYKIGKISVSYVLYGLTRSINLVSNFAPPSIESPTGGGTLSIRVVDAIGMGVSAAEVRIINTTTSPTIDFVTFTNINGYAVIGGAAPSSQYQIHVSRSGYSSAQTYERTSHNINPTPGHLTVARDQVTTGTFFIDRLSTLAIASFSPAITTGFSDLFDNASSLASQTNTQVVGGALTFSNDELSGAARSTVIAPNTLAGWGILSANTTIPAGTSAIVQVGDSSGVLLPDSVLAGNSVGFSSFPVSLTEVPVTIYSGLTFFAGLTRNATTTAPAVLDWSLSYTVGPMPLPNATFTLTGGKSIGTDPDNRPIPKTVVNGSTGSGAQTSHTLEWDSYVFTLTGGNLISSCETSPIFLPPSSAANMTIIAGVPTSDVLPVLVTDGNGVPVPNARITLEKSGFAATIFTSLCGQAFFNGLASGTYNARVSASGHATTTFTGINVAGHTATSTLVLP